MKHLALICTLACSFTLNSFAQIPAEDLNLLQQLVNTNSGSMNLPGLQAVRQKLIPAFEKLGFQSRVLQGKNGKSVLTFEMKNSKPTLLMLGHTDTVFEPSHSFQKFTKVGSKLQGPGVIDAKGSVVLVLRIVTELKAKGVDLSHFRIAFSEEEEIGSPNSREAFKEISQGIQYGLVYEPGLPDGSLVTSHSGLHWIEIKIKGKPSHAGLEPEKGISAAQELVAKAAKIYQLSLPRGVTLNLGTLSGGTKPNIVCEDTTMVWDMRYQDRTDRNSVAGQISEIVNKSEVYNPKLERGTQSTMNIVMDSPSLPSKSTTGLFALAQKAAASLGKTVTGIHVGYGTDGGAISESSAEMQLLVGLGPYGGGMHTTDEFMDEASYEERLKLNLALIDLILK